MGYTLSQNILPILYSLGQSYQTFRSFWAEKTCLRPEMVEGCPNWQDVRPNISKEAVKKLQRLVKSIEFWTILSRGGIQERTLTLRFLGVISRVLRLEVSTIVFCPSTRCYSRTNLSFLHLLIVLYGFLKP